MAKTKRRDEAATPTSDGLTIEQVERWLHEQIAKLRQTRRAQPRLPHQLLDFEEFLFPGSLDRLDEEINVLGTRLRTAQEVARHIRELGTLLVTFGPRSNAEPSATPSSRRPAVSTAPNTAPHNRDRWRKRPLTEKERDDIRMDLLRARAAGEEALERAKREACERHGLSRKAVAGLLNTCTGKRFALNFAARVVSRAPQAQRRAQLVVQLSNYLGIRRDRIMRAVRENERA